MAPVDLPGLVEPRQFSCLSSHRLVEKRVEIEQRRGQEVRALCAAFALSIEHAGKVVDGYWSVQTALRKSRRLARLSARRGA
ncbi:MAG: hypothetical protein HY719_12005 [Planctomycetes bacterium]|nr:hypothetical protein [Planctomycetota bacterium]